MFESSGNDVANETSSVERQLKERWERMVKTVRSNVDYMDANHWMHLDTAISQVENLLSLPNPKVSYRRAFIRLHMEVYDNYVSSDAPEEDGAEETYHLLKYFELGFAENQQFKTYLRVKLMEIADKKNRLRN